MPRTSCLSVHRGLECSLPCETGATTDVPSVKADTCSVVLPRGLPGAGRAAAGSHLHLLSPDGTLKTTENTEQRPTMTESQDSASWFNRLRCQGLMMPTEPAGAGGRLVPEAPH